MANSAVICIATCLLFGLVQAAVVYKGPVDMTVELNKWAQLNCTVNCSIRNVGWFMAGRSRAIKNNSIPGLAVMRPEPQSSACSSGQKTFFFSVLVTEALNKLEIAIYCAAYEPRNHQSECGTYYSKPALLTVKAAGTITPSTISRTLQISPSGSPSPCPTQSLQEPALAVVTLATTVTSSLTICPTPAVTSSSTGEVESVSAASARVAQLMVLAGLVITSILL